MDDRAALLERIHELEAALSYRDGELARLRQSVEALERLLWGGSERRPGPDPAVASNQLFLAGILEGALRGPAVEHAEVTTTIQVPAHVRTKEGRRSQFPEHLPVLTTRIELDASERTCRCGGDLVPMGQETSKELERVEFSLVHEIQRVTYCCRSCQENVVTAPAPDRVIDKGLLGVGFLAHVLTERFQHHMPYHRQERKYASEGLALSRSVLCSSAIRCAKLLQPIAEELKREILASGIVHTDDTPVTMLEDATGAKRQARVWIYRDIQGRCYFDCTESRSRDGPRAIFGDYAGYIVADAYPGYDRFFTEGTALEVACWAHTRRKFLAAESSEPELAREAIARIAELYAIEKAAADLEDEARRALRSEQARPRLAALRAWFAETRPTALDRGPLAGAIDYALANWDALVRYTEDGRLPIDNNAAERALRCVAVGRKNWMFVGNPEGGRAAAGVYSLVETCKAAGVNPRDYFQDVLRRIGRCSDVTRLTPHGWKQHFQAEVESRRHDALRRLFGTA